MSKRRNHRLDIRALDDQSLCTLMDLHRLLGSRRPWPDWATVALTGTKPSKSTFVEFRRLLHRAWKHVGWQTRMSLERIAEILRVPVPAEPIPKPKRKPKPKHVKLRRTKRPPAACEQHSPEIDNDPPPSPPPPQWHDDDAEGWQPVADDSFTNALHNALRDEERGWW